MQWSMYVCGYILLVTHCTIVLIRKNIGPRPIWIWLTRYFRIRTIVHCIANLSWFCYQTSYLKFSILGQWIYHDFESIPPSFRFPWDMEFVMVLSPYFTSDSIFFILSQQSKGDNSNWHNQILLWNLLGQYQTIIFNLKSG